MMKMMKVNAMRDIQDVDVDSVRLADIEPVIAKVELAMKKAHKSNCYKCDFVPKNQNGLTKHKKAKHTDKSS